METKFVPQFLEPKEVILCNNLTSYGSALGARKFDDGSFAVRYADGVVLYDNVGHVLEADLEDVLLFPWGFKLFKKKNSPYWYLVDASGNDVLCYVKCEAKKVCVSGNVIALCDDRDTWRVFQVSPHRSLIEYVLISYFDEDVKVFQNKNSNDFVVAFVRPDASVLLQHRVAFSTKVDKIAGTFQKFECLFNGCFICSHSDIVKTEYPDGSVAIYSTDEGNLALFDEQLNVIAQAFQEAFLFANGVYLLKFGEEWSLYSSENKLLRDKMRHLSVCQTADGCVVEAETEKQEKMLLESVDNNLVRLICGDDSVYFTPSGKTIKANSREKGCWLI